MVEKIRVSLWDIFTFFLTGLLATVLLGLFLTSYGMTDFSAISRAASEIPVAITVVAAPLVLTLLGMLIEPFANYLDKYVLRYLLGWASIPKQKHSAEEELLRKEICSKYLGSLNGQIKHPYAICKEYVETKQLSTTFMVFLSRYGFYRNCAFLAFVYGVGAAAFSSGWLEGVCALALGFFASAVFKRRAEDFYSYMAPSIYRAFLIDKVAWVPKDGP